MKLTEVKPNEWMTALEDGRTLYLRYRHGHLQWGKGKTASSARSGASISLGVVVDNTGGRGIPTLTAEEALSRYLEAQ